MSRSRYGVERSAAGPSSLSLLLPLLPLLCAFGGIPLQRDIGQSSIIRLLYAHFSWSLVPEHKDHVSEEKQLPKVEIDCHLLNVVL